MRDNATILIVDDDEDILTAGRLLLRREFPEVLTCTDPAELPELMARHEIDVMLLDMNFGPGESSGEQGLHWLERILEIDPQAIVVMITAHGSVNTAVEAMKRGATDFVAKPWQNERVVATVSAALKLRRSREESESLREANRALMQDGGPSRIIGESPAIRNLLDVVRRAAPTEANVLILGENGSGKELIARELHRLSMRAGKVFLTIDMGSVSESLFESELFGYRKGAFTGADEDRVGRILAIRNLLDVVRRAAPTEANVLILGENGSGKELIARELHRLSMRAGKVFLTIDMGSVSESLFESELFGYRKGAFTGADEDRVGRILAANGGTLFLDEIGNLPLNLQAKLLHVLEQRQVTPVGSDRAHPFDVRIIAATNVPAEELRDETKFRTDLLFRLNTVEVTVPPLRDRREDILPIADYFLEQFSRKYGGRRRSFSKAAREALQDYDWPGNVRALRHAVERAVILSENDRLGPSDLQLDYAAAQPAAAVMPTILNLDHMEKETILKALRKHGFNISRAANELGLTRASLYRRMEKHDI